MLSLSWSIHGSATASEKKMVQKWKKGHNKQKANVPPSKQLKVKYREGKPLAHKVASAF